MFANGSEHEMKRAIEREQYEVDVARQEEFAGSGDLARVSLRELHRQVDDLEHLVEQLERIG